ncbi:MAG: hypothetical protein MZV70_50890 [Desulfobacterales bacterium]|nr:hypothetical protein [Desulfobacterales bacterium]
MKLTDAAERMSLGELNVKIDVTIAGRNRPAGPGHRPDADQLEYGDGPVEEEEMIGNA